jgi:NAD(P)-dependent dehydrogenase (short-subunit alcohol dehydrogenase family)
LEFKNLSIASRTEPPAGRDRLAGNIPESLSAVAVAFAVMQDRKATCLITGANRGIGKAAAIELVRRGQRVVIVSRDRERGDRARREIGAETSIVADLASLESVRSLAEQARATLPPLDVLVHNAGVFMNERASTVDGIETTFAVNHLAPFLLTHELLDHLAPEARIVVVSSEAHRGARLRLDDLQLEGKYSGGLAYANSKLANILFTRELARRLEGRSVTANCLHPGVIRTGLLDNYFRDLGWLGSVARRLSWLFTVSEEKGAETTIHLASSPEVAGVSGAYFKRCREARPSAAARDDDAARRLWEISEELVRPRS